MATSLQVHAASAWHVIANCQAHAAGSWQQVQTAYVHAGGSWQTVWVNFTAHNTMVAGTQSSLTGYVNATFDPPGCGSISPTTDVGGHTIYSVENSAGSSFNYLLHTFSNLGQSYFTTFEIYGSDIGLVKLLSSAATYVYNSGTGNCTWSWSSGIPTITSGNTYGIATI